MAANLNLEAASSYANLIGIASTQDAGMQRVNPGNPDMSYLITKLEGPGASGGQMPPSGPLPQADIDVIRQWITDGAIDDTVVPNNPVRVTTLTPMPGTDLQTGPTQIVAGFDREVDATTVDANSFIVDASGGDGIFGNGNDVNVVATTITVPAANPQSAIFTVAAALADDTYQVTLVGNGATAVMDLGGNALDGEYPGSFPSGNGAAGGDFQVRFTVTSPVVIGPTIFQIQTVIFTPTCATAGCHDAGTAAQGLVLTDEATSVMNLVGIASSQSAGAIRVDAGNADNSYLIQKLENNGIVGAQMPLGRPPLAQTDIDHIRDWINAGAID
jgi:hypothetical protein